ncbi:MAG: OadG family protein [Dehalococcoidales bacterium]
MAIDWGFAWQIGGVGFGVVFMVLIILGLAIWLTGLIIGKIEAGKEEAGNNEKGA